jgi:hypothetical protein
LDDLYLVAGSLREAQFMLDEVADRLAQLGLHLNVKKVKWMANKYAADVRHDSFLRVGMVKIFGSEEIVCLGIVIRCDLKEDAAVLGIG